MRELLEIVHPTKGRLKIEPTEWEKYEAIGCTKVGVAIEQEKVSEPHDTPEQLDIEEDE